MGCHLVGLTPEARVRVHEELRFRGVRLTYGEAEVYGGGGPTLCDALIDCQLGARRRTGTECLHCPRLLSWEQGPTEHELTLHCAWLHSDPVADRMTGLGALVAVAPSLGCREAARVAASEGVHRLLVVDEDRVVGIVCRHDLARAPSERVGTIMQRQVFVIGAAATLGEAAAAMRDLDIGCLPVTREDRLVGILTRGDLIRAGLPSETFA